MVTKIQEAYSKTEIAIGKATPLYNKDNEKFVVACWEASQDLGTLIMHFDYSTWCPDVERTTIFFRETLIAMGTEDAAAYYAGHIPTQLSREMVRVVGLLASPASGCRTDSFCYEACIAIALGFEKTRDMYKAGDARKQGEARGSHLILVTAEHGLLTHPMFKRSTS